MFPKNLLAVVILFYVKKQTQQFVGLQVALVGWCPEASQYIIR
jgi:hypothetical protein